MVWESIVVLGLVIGIPIVVAAILGRKPKKPREKKPRDATAKENAA